MLLDYFDAIQDKPKFVTSKNINYLTVMGSHAYGSANENSDWDYYGFCTPPLEVVFPHVSGIIPNFGRNIQKFDQFQIQHLVTPDGKETDIQIYNIVKYFQLVMEGNPNMIDSLFTDDIWVEKCDNVGSLIRDNKKMFLSQKCYHTFRGMVHSHMNRLMNRERIGNRKEYVDKFGYDTKDASHIIRLIYGLSDILFCGFLIPDKYGDTIKEIRNGEWTKEDVINEFNFCMEQFERLKETWVVPYSPDEAAIHNLLVECLEESYGSLSNVGFNTI